MQFLQLLSSEASQELTYHCKNSIAVYDASRRSLRNALQIMTTSDIQLKARGNKKFRYRIVQDGCKVSIPSPLMLLIYCTLRPLGWSGAPRLMGRGPSWARPSVHSLKDLDMPQITTRVSCRLVWMVQTDHKCRYHDFRTWPGVRGTVQWSLNLTCHNVRRWTAQDRLFGVCVVALCCWPDLSHHLSHHLTCFYLLYTSLWNLIKIIIINNNNDT